MEHIRSLRIGIKAEYPVTSTSQGTYVRLEQGSSNLDLEIHFPAEFSSNPNQTHLNKLIKVFRITKATDK